MQRASRRKHHIIYKTTCLKTNKWYIGMHSTDNLGDGYIGSGQVLWKSIKKYGKEHHRCEILEHLNDRESLSVREEEILTKELRDDPLCMNIRSGGTGNYPGTPVSEETRAKLSIASKRFVRTKEHYEKVVATRKANSSYKHSEETKKQLSEMRKGRTLTEEHKAAIAEGTKGRIVTDETRAKISKANIGKQVGIPKGPLSEETKQKLRLAQTGRKYSEESRALMSQKAKARCERSRLAKLNT